MSSNDLLPVRMRPARFGFLLTIVETPSLVMSSICERWSLNMLENMETKSLHMLSTPLTSITISFGNWKQTKNNQNSIVVMKLWL